MGLSLFNFASTDENMTPVSAMARKIGRALAPIFDAVSGSQPQQKPTVRDTYTNLDPDRGSLNVVPTQWKVAQDRKSMYMDIENMDRNDELVSTALDITANNGADFLDDVDQRIRFKSKDKEVLQVLERMSERLNLNDLVWQLVRECAMHGSIFREVVLDRTSDTSPFIADFKQTIPFHIWPNLNEKGDKLPGWVVKLDLDVYNGGGERLAEWQIVPFIFGARKGWLSVPPLASARSGYQRLAKIEDGMAVARLIRAYDKMVHKIPVGKEWEKDQILTAIRTYRDAITKRKVETTDGLVNQLDNPLDVQTDFYVPDDGSGRGDVHMLTSNNTNLGNLMDVYYAREKLLARLRVPIEMLQLTSQQKTHISGKGGDMSAAQVQFAKYLRSLQAVLRRGISRLCDIELMLQCPEKYASGQRNLYTIELCSIDTADPQQDAALLLTLGQACVYFLEAFGALPPQLMASKFMNLTSDEQEMMKAFLDSDAERILEARIEALENEALAPLATKTKIGEQTNPPKPGSGNNNKSRAARSTEQKGKKSTQGMSSRLREAMLTQDSSEMVPVLPIDELVELFARLQSMVNEDLSEAGIPVPEVTEFTKQVIRQNLVDLASC
jgi:hypothetical protein